MSNADKAVDLLLTGEETVTEIVNMANKTTFTFDQLILGAPRPSADEGYNTDLEITFPVPPTAGDPAPPPVTGEMHYNRLDLGRLFSSKSIRLRDNNFTTVRDLITALLEEARLKFDLDDLEDSAIPAVAYPRTVVLKAEKLSLRFVGQFSLEILEPVVADTSFITVPAVVENTTLSQMARKTDGTLFKGEGHTAEQMYVASNGEIEVGGAARLLNYSQGIPAVGGTYTLNIADQGDWSVPFSFALLDTRNGDHITDLYDCTVKITVVESNAVLNFLLKRQYGKLAMVDAANVLTVEDPATHNDAQTLYQDITRTTFYKNKLGSLSLNAAGSPYGQFNVELKAVPKDVGLDPVVVAFTVDVEGLPTI